VTESASVGTNMTSVCSQSKTVIVIAIQYVQTQAILAIVLHWQPSDDTLPMVIQPRARRTLGADGLTRINLKGTDRNGQ
jgi:hypothetical protein